MAEIVGEKIGNYKLIRLLGTGLFSEVYLGEHILLNLQSAIKIVRAELFENTHNNTFRTELRALARLVHPNIVSIYDFGVIDDTNNSYNRPFLIMSFASNGTLRERHPKGTQVPFHQIIDYVNQMADALDYAHEQNIIHSDIKPENMLVGQNDEILLSDFGISAIVTTTITIDRDIKNETLFYMAPEQIEGHPQVASDQYALGIVVYEWLCGRRPFNGTIKEIIDQHLYTSPSFEKTLNIAPNVQQAVMKALNKNPEERYPTVKEFARALESEERTTNMLSNPVPYPEENRLSAPSTSAQHEPPPFDRTPTRPNVPPNPQNVYQEIQLLPSKEQKEILIKTFGSLSTKDKEEIVQETGIRPLSQQATDFIWKAVILGVVIVFVGSAVGVTLAVFVGANVAPLITVFTAVIALLGGLLAPSPVQNVIRSLSSNFKSTSQADKE